MRLKSLELKIDSPTFDYIGAMESIRQFGEKLALPRERTMRAQLLFEEFCIQTLIPVLKDDVNICTTFEFDEGNDVLTMAVEHNGEPVIDKLPEISAKIIGGIKDISIVEKCNTAFFGS